MPYFKCSKCNSKGYLIDIDLLRGIFTFGFGILDDLRNKEDCNICKGKGYIYFPIIKNKINWDKLPKYSDYIDIDELYNIDEVDELYNQVLVIN